MSRFLTDKARVTTLKQAHIAGDENALAACSAAREMLISIGFLLAYTSMISEACYYARSGHPGVIRIAAHRGGRRDGKKMGRPVLACITFGTNQGARRASQIESAVIFALGEYFMARLRAERAPAAAGA